MAAVFDPPGPGAWDLDRSHFPGGATPITQWLMTQGFHHGFRRVFRELGLPAQGIDIGFVHGFMYTRLLPLVAPDRPPGRLPPTPILKLATRLHPAFRARNKAAIASLRDRPSNAVVQRWNDELRPQLHAANRAFQSFDVDQADDGALQEHITQLLDQLHSNCILHFWLHGHDLGPIARYLHECLEWGLDPDRAIDALAGASPSTSEPIEALCELRDLLESVDAPITSLTHLRTSSGEAGTLIDSYLDARGQILATGYDLDARTLIEMPDVVLRTIRTATIPVPPDFIQIAAELRSQVPEASRASFDRYLADARNVMDMRDDNGPLAIEWPMGLLRRALLGAGLRLVERSALKRSEHLLEVTPDEARALFRGALPTSEALADRAAKRALQSQLDPPASLGPPEPEPPAGILPPALDTLIAMTQTAIDHIGMGSASFADALTGSGVGTERYVGVARVADSADDALDRLEPGDVLIVRATSPAFNAVLAIAGAVVTSDGGVLSHAAVLARELGLAAVIGASGALDIADGSTVEVDPVAGTVRVL